ncbi:putative uncharacterized protein [Parachlamydia acanthamoebae UV-7]|uniref:Uncharacterized protein n=2 Tax=Parachlamydia acanthamoebae TaxID=83552 RepID=F8KW69_PARAV|nr:hypothetical protein [Parachlamydia acanthamoebae]KIA78528.1 hypothetical protein DB43_DV00030 [Parachlamydia acanthamoebae]CCB85737.1 putative uncharacterized protein [Parachlamydia acanthamoebae UV-7]
MKRLIMFFIFAVFNFFAIFSQELPWSEDYQMHLTGRTASLMPQLTTYPSLESPINDLEVILKKFPDEKILLFDYGDLMNIEIASSSLSEKTIQSMKPAIAFGFKRLFNYKSKDPSVWGKGVQDNEKALLNLEPMTTYKSIVNGVVLEIGEEDLSQLVTEKAGYDLVPLLIADWNEALSQNPEVKIQIAYTFIAPSELRDNIAYTQTHYYPIRGNLFAVQQGAVIYGERFLDFLNATTYMANGTTLTKDWDQRTFSKILDSKEP